MPTEGRSPDALNGVMSVRLPVKYRTSIKNGMRAIFAREGIDMIHGKRTWSREGLEWLKSRERDSAQAEQIDFSREVVDSASVRAVFGGPMMAGRRQAFKYTSHLRS